eukprot:CAMPEP_0194207050 /NCGR_PEP_ID=MMETSP0156-20130528/5918_1 /TAXON_ID=33649 /ORGANISM="Thalassionema nitzschioides, Strain L26-B" /LENGTH=97 /DNA_ID=CAMNT_0038933731 /DNA_START=33 /DNA_END=326 /DNA_ORIENTATION=+
MASRVGSNLVLASVLSFLSYVPFEWVAKGSLIVCAVLFILDPIPPLTRIISVISLLVVHCLSQLYREFKTGNLDNPEDNGDVKDSIQSNHKDHEKND